MTICFIFVKRKETDKANAQDVKQMENSLTWTSFLYEIDGMKGLYCGKCVTLIINESRKDKSNDKDIS